MWPVSSLEPLGGIRQPELARQKVSALYPGRSPRSSVGSGRTQVSLEARCPVLR